MRKYGSLHTTYSVELSFINHCRKTNWFKRVRFANILNQLIRRELRNKAGVNSKAIHLPNDAETGKRKEILPLKGELVLFVTKEAKRRVQEMRKFSRQDIAESKTNILRYTPRSVTHSRLCNLL